MQFALCSQFPAIKKGFSKKGAYRNRSVRGQTINLLYSIGKYKCTRSLCSLTFLIRLFPSDFPRFPGQEPLMFIKINWYKAPVCSVLFLALRLSSGLEQPANENVKQYVHPVIIYSNCFLLKCARAGAFIGRFSSCKFNQPPRFYCSRNGSYILTWAHA